MRKVLFVTGKRGGFEGMVPTLELLRDDPAFDLQMMICDMHVNKMFGMTADGVEEAMPVVSRACQAFPDRKRTLLSLHTSVSLHIAEFQPDIVLLIGDRGEQLVSAVAAQQAGCFIAHVEGGDITGTLDDSARHAISKLAHVHFCSTEAAKSVLLRLGEEEKRIHVVGDVHIDSLMRELEKPFREIEWAKDAVIVLFHPDSDEPADSGVHFDEIEKGTRDFKRAFIYPCSDLGHEHIVSKLSWLEEAGETVFRNVPHEDFVMAMRQARCLVGNSSAGVKEAPYCGLAAVNVGNRQQGRGPEYGSTNVTNVSFGPPHPMALHPPTPTEKIRECVEGAMRIWDKKNYYGDGQAYKRIHEVLKTMDLDSKKTMRHLLD